MVFCKISENSWDGGEFLLLFISGSLVPSLHLKNRWFNGPVSNYIDLWQLALFLHFHSLNIARNFGKQRKGWHYSNTNNFQSNRRCYCCEKSSASLTSEIPPPPPPLPSSLAISSHFLVCVFLLVYYFLPLPSCFYITPVLVCYPWELQICFTQALIQLSLAPSQGAVPVYLCTLKLISVVQMLRGLLCNRSNP